MTIGVFHVDTPRDAGRGYDWARALVATAKQHMPDVPIVHFTDLASPALDDVDGVSRLRSEPMAMLRMRHHANVSGDWLFVDTDVWFQADVRAVFDYRFDLAVTDRVWPHLRMAEGFTERMGFNTGVVFSRHRSFWRAVLARLQRLPLDSQQWMGDQEVICALAQRRHDYHVRELPGAIYNFPPAFPDDDPRYGGDIALSARLQPHAQIVHYKGVKRKRLLDVRMRVEGPCVSA